MQMIAPPFLTVFPDTLHSSGGVEAVAHIWAQCRPTNPAHPYLARYELPALNLREWKGCLIGPLTDEADRLIGLLIVGNDGETRSWIPQGGLARLVVGPQDQSSIVASTSLADALALHAISGECVYLAPSQEIAGQIYDRLAQQGPRQRIRTVGLSAREASSAVAPGRMSENHLVLPFGTSWAELRLSLGLQSRSWIDDPVLIFGGAVSAPGLVVRKSGLWYVFDDGSAFPVCGPIMPVAIVRSENGHEWSRIVWMRDRDHKARWLRIPDREVLLDTKRLLTRLIDAGLDISGPSALPGLVTHLKHADVSSRRTLVRRCGWHGHHYVSPVGTVGSPYSDMPVNEAHLGAASASDDVEVALWQRVIATPAEDNSRLVLAICSAFAGLIVGLFEEQGTFGVHLRGLSSTGKSTALAVAASIFGPAMREIQSWRSTDNGLETLAHTHHHRLLLLDEIAQIDARAAAQAGYTLGNGRGKKRANGDGTGLKSAAWQLVFLSSGEIGLADKIAEWVGAPMMRDGQAVRVIDLAADAGRGWGIFDTLHGMTNGADFSDALKAAAERSTGDVALAFLRQVTCNVAAARNSLKHCRDQCLRMHLAEQADAITQRVLSNFSLLAAAGELAIEYGILPWKPGHASVMIAACAQDWTSARATEARPDAIAIAGEWLRQNAGRLAPWEQGETGKQAELGYFRLDPPSFYLRPAGWAALCKGSVKKNVEAPLSDAGLLRHTSARLPGGRLQRFRIIDAAIIERGSGNL